MGLGVGFGEGEGVSNNVGLGDSIGVGSGEGENEGMGEASGEEITSSLTFVTWLSSGDGATGSANAPTVMNEEAMSAANTPAIFFLEKSSLNNLVKKVGFIKKTIKKKGESIKIKAAMVTIIDKTFFYYLIKSSLCHSLPVI